MLHPVLLRNARSARSWPVFWLLLLLGLASTPGYGASVPKGPVSFSRDIAPILINKCQICHGPDKAKGKYRLQTFELLNQPGGSKSAPVTAGKPAASKIYELITAKDPDNRMPQEDNPLPAAQIALVERWIKEGAKFDGLDAKASLVTLLPRKAYPAPPAAYLQPTPILALAFSPGGHELAASGYHEITIWNPADGSLLRRIKNVPLQTHALAYNADGTLLATATGDPGKLGEVALYDPAKGALVKVLATLGDTALDVKFSPDGTRLASAGADNAIRIFDLASRKETLRIEQHADWVMSLCWNTNGSEIASASRDKTARVFNATNGVLEATFADHGEPVFAVAFSEDGTQVYSAGRDKKIRTWESKTGNAVGGKKSKSNSIGGFDGDIFQLLVQGDFIFSACADQYARQHNISDRSLVHKFSGHNDWVYSLACDAKSRHLATGSYDGEIRIWDVDDGKLVLTFRAAPGFVAANKGK